jgi:hypothetical protein
MQVDWRLECPEPETRTTGHPNTAQHVSARDAESAPILADQTLQVCPLGSPRGRLERSGYVMLCVHCESRVPGEREAMDGSDGPFCTVPGCLGLTVNMADDASQKNGPPGLLLVGGSRQVASL